MTLLRPHLHRFILALLLLGNAVCFAGVDPLTGLVTAGLCLALVLDLKKMPPVPSLFRRAALAAALLWVLQLLPLPAALRRLLQPGLAAVMHDGWAPLSLAPWATVESAAALALTVAVALAAARMTQTRSGLPVLLMILAATAALLAALGLVGESGGVDQVLLMRANTGGGSPYGPYVNRNHFAQGMELALPAAVVLLAVAGRQLTRRGEARQRASLMVLAAGVTLAVGAASVLRSTSRGGVLVLAVAWLVTTPLWLRRQRATRWPWLVACVVVALLVLVLASTQLGVLEERLANQLMQHGLHGNTRLDLWSGTAELWLRAPLLGCGIGAYKHVIALDKPPTGSLVLEQAHNDWLEWLATSGAVGMLLLLVVAAALLWPLRPAKLRQLRFEARYPLAGAAMAFCATGMHEAFGFGLQTPLNRYLLATWIGLTWGLLAKVERPAAKRPAAPEGIQAADSEHGDPEPAPPAHEDAEETPCPDQTEPRS